MAKVLSQSVLNIDVGISSSQSKIPTKESFSGKENAKTAPSIPQQDILRKQKSQQSIVSVEQSTAIEGQLEVDPALLPQVPQKCDPFQNPCQPVPQQGVPYWTQPPQIFCSGFRSADPPSHQQAVNAGLVPPLNAGQQQLYQTQQVDFGPIPASSWPMAFAWYYGPYWAPFMPPQMQTQAMSRLAPPSIDAKPAAVVAEKPVAENPVAENPVVAKPVVDSAITASIEQALALSQAELQRVQAELTAAAQADEANEIRHMEQQQREQQQVATLRAQVASLNEKRNARELQQRAQMEALQQRVSEVQETRKKRDELIGAHEQAQSKIQQRQYQALNDHTQSEVDQLEQIGRLQAQTADVERQLQEAQVKQAHNEQASAELRQQLEQANAAAADEQQFSEQVSAEAREQQGDLMKKLATEGAESAEKLASLESVNAGLAAEGELVVVKQQQLMRQLSDSEQAHCMMLQLLEEREAAYAVQQGEFQNLVARLPRTDNGGFQTRKQERSNGRSRQSRGTAPVPRANTANRFNVLDSAPESATLPMARQRAAARLNPPLAVPQAAPVAKQMSVSEAEKAACGLIQEYISVSDKAEVIRCVEEIPAGLRSKVIECGILATTEQHDEDRSKFCELLVELSKAKLLDESLFEIGVTAALKDAADVVIDAPKFFDWVAMYLAKGVVNGYFGLQFLPRTYSHLIEDGNAEKFVFAVFKQITAYRNSDTSRHHFEESGIDLRTVVNGGDATMDDLLPVLAQHNLDYLMPKSDQFS